MRYFQSALRFVLTAVLAAPSAAEVRLLAPALRASLPLTPASLALPRPAMPIALLPAVPTVAPAQPTLAAVAQREQSPAIDHTLSERFWSGARTHARDFSIPVPVDDGSAPVQKRRSLAAHNAPSYPAAIALPAAFAPPSGANTPALLLKALPFFKAGAVLLGAYLSWKVFRRLINRAAAAGGWSPESAEDVRSAAKVVVAVAAAGGTLILGGAPPLAVGAAAAAGSTLLGMVLEKPTVNFLHGVDFLITRPLRIGDMIEIEEQKGILDNLEQTYFTWRAPDGSESEHRYAPLASKTVILHGDYDSARAEGSSGSSLRTRLRLSSFFPREGARAIWDSLDRGFLFAAAATTSLATAAHAWPALDSGWSATALHWLFAGSILHLIRRIELVLINALTILCDSSGQPRETRIMLRLATRVATWLLGVTALMIVIGLPWQGVAGALGTLATGVGVAARSYLSSIIQSRNGKRLVRIGEMAGVGRLYRGEVVDKTFHHLVLRIAEDRYALVPYDLLLESAVNHPQRPEGRSP